MPSSILIVEDEPLIAMELEGRLTDMGYAVSGAVSNGEAALRAIETARPDLVLMDIRIQGPRDGIEMAEEIDRRFDIPVVYVTAHADEAMLRRAKATGPFGYLLKPFREQDLRPAIEVAIYKHDIERKLRESEARYRTLAESAQDLIFTVDRDGTVLYANAFAAQRVGIDPAEMVGKRIADLFPPAVAERKLASVRQVFDGKEPLQVDDRSVMAGRDVWLSTKLVPLMDSHGGVTAVLGIARDITSLKQTEEALRTHSQVLFSMAEGAHVVDERGIIRFTNPAIDAMFGYRPGELVGKHVAILNAGTEVENARLVASIVAELQGNGAWQGEFRNRRKDGSLFDTRARITTLNQSGEALWVTVQEDITERKRAEDALRESRRTFVTLLDNLPGAVYRCRNDKDWTVEFMSEGIRALTGYSAADFTEKKIAYGTIIHPEDQESVWNRVQAALAENQTFELLYRIRTAAGDERWVWERGQGVFSPAGELLFLEGFITDITERRLAEEEIQKLNSGLERRVAERTAELEASNQEMETFSYSVSHDLRAPLRAISGFSQMLLAGYADRLDDRGKEYLQRVHTASGRMAELIEALLSLARIGRGGIWKERLDLTMMARLIVADLQKSDPARDVTVTIHEALAADGDPRLMRIILENLLGNAWKFTSRQPKATIEFGRTERDGASVFFLRDNGAGFDMAYSHKLFGAFQRLHNRDEFEGTGIGLATVQRIIQRHGGRIWAEAAVGSGATFYVAI